MDLKPLASELMSDPGALAEHWPWLTSGDAADGWRLGQALAAEDSNAQLAEKMPILPGAGDDLRVIGGYISYQRKAFGEEWYENWLRSQSGRKPKPANLLFDVAWRSGSNSVAALLLAETLGSEKVSPAIVGRLAFGRWGQDLPMQALGQLLEVMTQAGHSETAIAILINRINSNPEELDQWKPLCLRLVVTPHLIRSGQMANFY